MVKESSHYFQISFLLIQNYIIHYLKKKVITTESRTRQKKVTAKTSLALDSDSESDKADSKLSVPDQHNKSVPKNVPETSADPTNQPLGIEEIKASSAIRQREAHTVREREKETSGIVLGGRFSLGLDFFFKCSFNNGIIKFLFSKQQTLNFYKNFIL